MDEGQTPSKVPKKKSPPKQKGNSVIPPLQLKVKQEPLDLPPRPIKKPSKLIVPVKLADEELSGEEPLQKRPRDEVEDVEDVQSPKSEESPPKKQKEAFSLKEFLEKHLGKETVAFFNDADLSK